MGTFIDTAWTDRRDMLKLAAFLAMLTAMMVALVIPAIAVRIWNDVRESQA